MAGLIVGRAVGVVVICSQLLNQLGVARRLLLGAVLLIISARPAGCRPSC